MQPSCIYGEPYISTAFKLKAPTMRSRQIESGRYCAGRAHRAPNLPYWNVT